MGYARKMRRRLTQTQGLTFVAIAATLWGTIPLLVRQVDAPAVVIVFWRMAFASLVVLPFIATSGSLRAEVAALPRRKFAAMGLQGLLLALNWVLFFTGLQLAPVAVAELLAYCGPVFVAALAPIVGGTRFDKRIIVPLVLSLAGIVAILDPARLSVGGPREWLGAGAAFASALTYAALILNAKRLLQGVSSAIFMTTEWLVAGAVLLPVTFFLPHPTGAHEWFSLAALGIVMTAGTGFFFVSALRDVRADRTAILTYIEPASAVVFAAIFLGEPLTAATVAGGAAIVAAGIVVARLEPDELLESSLEVPGAGEREPRER
jgi:drug/metabolite transporter (DMT)-like permease